MNQRMMGRWQFAATKLKNPACKTGNRRLGKLNDFRETGQESKHNLN
jgi:hypothetical protein